MAHLPLELLHVGHGPELTLFEYLARVLLHLVALGGVAVLALRLTDAIGARRSLSNPPNGSSETDSQDS